MTPDEEFEIWWDTQIFAFISHQAAKLAYLQGRSDEAEKMKGEMEKLHCRFREEIDYRIDQNGELQKENQRLQVRISELEKQLKEGKE